MPLVRAVYTASKTAIEGFAGSLAHELAAFDVRVKLVEPGVRAEHALHQQHGLTRVDGLIPAALRAAGESASTPAWLR